MHFDVGTVLSLQEPLQQAFQETQHGRSFTLSYLPDSDARFQAIQLAFDDTSWHRAIDFAYSQVSFVLTCHSINLGVGLSIKNCYGIDKNHDVHWECVWFPAPVIPLKQFEGIGVGRRAAALLSLYREGRNSLSPFYRFLCYYKIIEKAKWLFREADQYVRRHKLAYRRPKRFITDEMHARCFPDGSWPSLLRKKLTRLPEILNDHRVKVAHAIDRDGDLINLDDYQVYATYVKLSSLLDLAALVLIGDELDISAAIIRHNPNAFDELDRESDE